MPRAEETKPAWRRAVAGVCGLLSCEERRDADAILSEKLRECASSRKASLVLGFCPLPDEPDITPFLRQWLADGGGLALPAWVGKSRLILRRVGDLDRDLCSGRASIPEPLAGLPEVSPDEPDLALVPGRAFSESCMRLGRGAGCYDWLLRGKRMLRVGVAYDFQIFPRIPATPEDEEMDMIVTPARSIVNIRARQAGRDRNEANDGTE